MIKMETIADAYEIIRRHQTQAPVKLVPIAEGLGVDVFSVKSGWPDEISGKIERHGSKYKIYVNANHSKKRARFTVAHELAHFILHRDEIGDGIVDDALYRSKLGGRKEVEANKLAADILMPWHLIEQALKENPQDIEELAKKFDVSNSAMSIRLGVPYEIKDEELKKEVKKRVPA